MVSFWPFRGDDTSAAGFEKILSSLSEKINKTSAKDARLRSQQRRFRALWTLYTGFAYLVALLILVLVVGQSNWNITEYSALAGGPVLIYAIRLSIDTFYNYRVAGTQTYLDDLYKQRSEVIEKLKAATKYNSTQQLLEKYGGSAPKAPKQSSEKRKPSGQKGPQIPNVPNQRTGILPPPTANIPNRISPPQQPQSQNITPGRSVPSAPHPASPPDTTAEFAPNAFNQPSNPTDAIPPQHLHIPGGAPQPQSGTSWYDRLMDVILGEDETAARNRIVLLCAHCRLVNGQAPPGTRGLEDVGRWRCMGCGAMNGVESAAERAVKEAVAGGNAGGGAGGPASPVSADGKDGVSPVSAGALEGASPVSPLGGSEEDGVVEDSDGEAVSAEEEPRPETPVKSSARATRSGARQRKKQ